MEDLLKIYCFLLLLKHGKNICFRCNKEINRETFSIEHKIAWLDSSNPKELFFDLNNIAFSHVSCNAAASRGNRKYETKEEASYANRRWEREVRIYNPEKRKAQYLRTGK